MKIYKNLLPLLILAFFCQDVCAQASVDSPYSRFGLGQIREKTLNTRLGGMGGIANAISGKGIINPENPASYAQIDTLSLLFDASFYMKSSTFSTTTLSENAANASFDYASMAFAATRWWKMAIGLQPYSDVGYNVVVNGYDNFIGNYATAFEGSGGLNQLYWGNGFRINKNFSVGLNATYVFGQNVATTTLYFPDSSYMVNTRRSSGIMVNDFMLDYGLLYKGDLGDGLTLGLGLTYNQKMKMSAKRELYIRSMEGGAEGSVEYPIDTVLYQSGEKISFSLPQGFGFGVSLQKNNRWLIGADFNWSEWKGFEMGGVNDSLQNSWIVSVGGEYSPASTSVSGYWTRMTYRVGGFYEQTYLNIYGQSINKFGATVGVSMPLPKSLSTLNLALEVGQCGTKSDGLILERYVNLSVGMSIYERWFVKRRYK